MKAAVDFLNLHFPEWENAISIRNQARKFAPGNRESQAKYYKDMVKEALGKDYDITIIYNQEGYSQIYIEKLEEIYQN